MGLKWEVENIKRAQNPIGMAIARIRTIERESGRPKDRCFRRSRAPSPVASRLTGGAWLMKASEHMIHHVF